MLDETQQQSLVTRLNRIEGQVRGIRRMVQEPRVCVELLQQLAAAEAALNRISLAVLRYHVEQCVPNGVVLGEPEPPSGCPSWSTSSTVSRVSSAAPPPDQLIPTPHDRAGRAEMF